MKPKLTVITTTYNQEKYIRSALDGIVMQETDFPFVAYICDDGSTDSTKKILKQYAKKYSNIIIPIFNKQNVGAMDNFVNTLSLAKTEYVALCDGDDYWTDNKKLQKQIDFLDNNKEYSICFHSTKIFFEDGSKSDEIYPREFKKSSNLDDLLKDSFIPANTVVYRWRFNNKKCLKDVFPKNIVPGDYYVHLLHAQKGKIGFIKETMSCYRRHSGGMWWLTSQINGQDEFISKYGIKYLNFYKEVDKHFKLDKEFNALSKNYLTNELIRFYLSQHMFEELLKFSHENKELFDSCITNFSFVPIYDNLSKIKKIWYLIFIDQKKLKQKLIEKANSKRKIWIPLKILYWSFVNVKRFFLKK